MNRSMFLNSIAFAAADAGKGAGKSSAPPPPPVTPPATDGTVPPAAGAPAAADGTNGTAGGNVVAKVEKAPVKVAAIRTDILPPAPKRSGPRAGTSLYDFEKLDINGSFGIIDLEKTAKKFGSTVTAANHRYDVAAKNPDGTAQMTVGAEIKDAAGNVTGHAPGKPVMIATRKFTCADVDPKSDPDGANLRVWRVALPTA